MEYCCYIIYNYNCSYVGITNNPINRIKRHNQEMSGGAKYTKMIGPGWKYICQIHGFKNKIHALQFEWAVKHMGKYKKGIENRILNLFKILNKHYWTKKSPESLNYNLKVIWNDITFIPENYTLPNYIDMDIIDSYNLQ